MKIRKRKAWFVADDDAEFKGYTLTRPTAVFNMFRNILRAESEFDRGKEHIWVVGLNSANTVKFIELVTLGTLTASVITPREILRPCIYYNVASFICAHNHPSGEVEPSRADIDITHKLQDAGEIMSIQMLDHIIIGSHTFKSLFTDYPEFRK